MLKYLIIQLDDSSVSFCHYENDRTRSKLIPLESLKEAIFWSMKENLTLQFLYPDYEIPSEYKKEITNTFHADIVASTCEDTELRENADVVVFDSFAGIIHYPFNKQQSYVLRLTMQDLFDNVSILYSILPKVNRINIVITDITALTDEKERQYKEFLESLAQKVADECKGDHALQINLLTDRILLDAMNNCNAGDESIALCPDSKFYVCPAFYADGKKSYSIGSLESGLDLKNPQLYKLSHAPICRNCDAYQCKRCVWLNRKTTLEVNTPSHEQCVTAHIERNASRKLLERIREIGVFMPEKVIPEIDYLDPFDKIQK
ncbi:MAG: CXXX repeat peptide maturase [Muribaculaceae bacterium]|nr:CXXX repeat peptide maturase [Muribaculaceae bacterium]